MKAQQDVAALTTRVTTAETNITKNADAIQLSATRTEEIGNLLVNDYYTKSQTDAAIKVQADSITQHVSSTYAVKTNTIKSSVEEFYQSTSPTALSGGTWSTTQPTWTQGKYIWRRTKNTYGNDVVSYSPSTDGVCVTGNTGATGPAGQNGNGVSSYSVTYQAGTSGTTAPTGTWTTTIPSVPQGQYLWTKIVITYTDNTSTSSYSVSYIPTNGQNGATGATGNGVKSIDTEFYLSTSKTTQTDGSWSTTQPTWSHGKYVWTRNKITYTNGSTSYTTPQCSSEWEAVNNLQIGGTNLLRNTKDEHTVTLTDLSEWVEGRTFVIEPTKNGEQYVLSFEAKASENGYIMQNHWWYCYSGSQQPVIKAVDQDGNVQISKPGTDGRTFTTLTTEYKRYYIVFDVRDSVGKTNIIVGRLNDIRKLPNTGWVKIKEFKLEKGNRPTAWSPAPEDMATALGNSYKVTSAYSDGTYVLADIEKAVSDYTTSVSKATLIHDGTSYIYAENASGTTFIKYMSDKLKKYVTAIYSDKYVSMNNVRYFQPVIIRYADLESVATVNMFPNF